jgi:multisubunit Na+/H+ antiporter MnhG subunit
VTSMAHIFMTLAVLGSWLATTAFVRMRTALERLHVPTYINVVTLSFLTIAGFFTDGTTPQTLKCVFIVLVNLIAGALGTYVTARAIHSRSGETR